MSITLKAKCIRCTFKKDDYRIFSWTPITNQDKVKMSSYFTFSTKGNDPYIDENREYEIEIEEISYDAKWGGCYKLISVPSINSINLEEMTIEDKKEILMDCTSSKRIANNILNAYPNFIELILEKGKDAIDTSKIYGVGEAYLNSYARSLLEKYKYLGTMRKFKDFKLDVADCKTLFANYFDEEHIAKVLESNPYRVLYRDLNRSFEKIDKMLLEIRPDLRVSEERCSCLILSVLEKNELEGSTRLNGNDLYHYIMNEYDMNELEPLIVPTATNSDLFYYDETSKDLSILTTYSAECNIANFVKNKIKNSTKLDINWNNYMTIDDFTMSQKQSKALEMFCEYNFMILAGYSGSGKTTSIRGIIKLMEDNNITYTLLAPTGKASMRITESVHRPSSTIHRKVLKDGEITTDVVIIDEMSMTDLPTFNMLIKAITNDNCRIILVGDNAQLMPVGIGCIFNDLINSNKVPMVMLDEIFRYDTDGGIFVATNVRQGKQFFDNEIVKKENNTYKVFNNYKFVQTNDVFEALVKEYNKLIDKGVKPNDILCLSPFNVGDEGTYKINNTIQSEVNPLKPQEYHLEREINKTTISFRIGDRLINKKNDYSALPYESWLEIENSNGLLTSEDVITTSVFNGQDGIIRDIDDKKIVAQFDEELLVFDKAKMQNLLLAYCISVHSSQGSEAKYVINVVSPKHKKMLNRNLLYVADTRSKIMQIDIGDMSTYNEALLIDGNSERFTWLKDLMNLDNI